MAQSFETLLSQRMAQARKQHDDAMKMAQQRITEARERVRSASEQSKARVQTQIQEAEKALAQLRDVDVAKKVRDALKAAGLDAGMSHTSTGATRIVNKGRQVTRGGTAVGNRSTTTIRQSRNY